MYARSSCIGAGVLLVLLASSPGNAWADEGPLQARLLDVRGDAVKLNKGSEQGVAEGQIFDLYEEAELYALPLTGDDRRERTVVKSHRRVASVQVIAVEPASARARVLAASTEDSRDRVRKGLRALHNPKAAAPNRRPEVIGGPSAVQAAWREEVALEFEISDDPGDEAVFTWEATGGWVAEARTRVPRNTWIAPPGRGDYQLTLTVSDSAGQTAKVGIDVSSTGIDASQRRPPSGFSSPRTYGAESMFGNVADLAFDATGQRFALNPKRGWGGQAVVRVGLPGGREVPVAVGGNLAALAVAEPGEQPGALVAIDAASKTVLYQPFGAAWKSLFQKPVVLGVPGGGTGNASLQQPVDVAVASSGEVYVLDAAQRAVQVFAVQPGEGGERGVFLVSFGRPGDGPLQLAAPRALAIDRSGHVYVLDDGRKMVVVYRDWRPLREFGVGATHEELVGLAVDPFSGDAYVLERTQGVLKHFDADGKQIGKYGASTERWDPAALLRPTRVRVDATRVVWVIDRDGEAVVRFDEGGRFLGRTGGIDLVDPLRVAGRPGGGFAAVERGEYRVTCFDEAGWVTARFGGEGSKPGRFEDPIDIAVDAGDQVYVLDAEKKSVQRFSPSGRFLGSFGRPGDGARDLKGLTDLNAVNDRSHLTVLQQRREHNFNLFHPERGQSVRTWGRMFTGDLTPRAGCVTGVTGRLTGSDPRAESRAPWFWTVDDDREKVYRCRPGEGAEAVGGEFDAISDLEPAPNDTVIVIDEGDRRLVVLDSSGARGLVVEGGDLDDPYDVGIDDLGRLYVYDSGLGRVVQLVARD